MTKVTLTENERKHYTRYSDACKHKSADEEYAWAETQTKCCNKCKEEKPLTCFGFSTSGSYPFDRHGVRYRRGDCLDCGKKISKGKALAKSKAKEMGISIKPNSGDKCALCDETEGLVFDHDHVSNKFRGWLCDPCNRAIGTNESRLGPDWLNKLINYVNKTSVPTPQ